jgi:hypothetical protein
MLCFIFCPFISFSQFVLNVDKIELEKQNNSFRSNESSVVLDVVENGDSTKIVLEKSEFLSEGFSVITNSGEKVPYQKPLYFTKSIKEEFFITCYLSNSFSRIVYNANNKYYEFSSLDGFNFKYINNSKKLDLDSFCNTVESVNKHKSNSRSSSTGNCVEIYVECGNDAYVENGSSVQATADWANGIYADVNTVYSLHSVPISVSQVVVWEVTEPYSAGSACGVLQAFADERQNNYNGRVASYITTEGDNLAGKAFQIGGICSIYDVGDNNCAGGTGEAPYFFLQGMDATYDGYPTYSLNVHGVAHELGHLLGSRHTHACVWNSNNTQIDDCGNVQAVNNSQTAEGAACFDEDNPIIPDDGDGTIMSYCFDLTDLSNGFGDQPGAVVFSNYSSAPCNTCCSIVLTAFAQCVISDESNFYINISFEAEGGSGSFTIVDNDPTTTYDLNNASSGTTYNFGPYPNGSNLNIEVSDNTSPCSDQIFNISENCEIECVNPIITDTDITCLDADNYSIAVTFTGESGALYDIYGSQTGSSFISNQPPGTYTITGNNDDDDLIVTVQNDEDSNCLDDIFITNNNCNENCQSPNIQSVIPTCQTNDYDIAVTFTGEPGVEYDIYAQDATSNIYFGSESVQSGTYDIINIPFDTDVNVFVINEEFPTECFVIWDYTAPDCGSNCVSPSIGIVDPICQATTYSLFVFISGTTGSEYDLYASGVSGTYPGADNQPPNTTYEISNIPFDEDVTIFLEDANDPLNCNDSQFEIAPNCSSGCNNPVITSSVTNCEMFDQYSLSFTFTGGNNEYDLSVFNGNTYYLLENQQSPGTYTAENIPVGVDVTLLVEDFDDNSCSTQQSISSPNCVDPTINVTWPNTTGQCFEPGENVNITWTTTGSVNSVNIEYCINNSNCETIINGTVNDGNHSWSIPPLSGNRYIKIYDPNDTPINDSGNVFEINNNCNGPCDDITVTLENPATLSEYNIGQNITFQWDAQNIGSGGCDLDDYHYRISSTPNMDAPQNVFDHPTAFLNTSISEEGSFWWQVRAQNENGEYGPWSSTRIVKICAGADDCKGQELELAANLIYPNEFCVGESTTVTAQITNNTDYPYYGTIAAVLLPFNSPNDQQQLQQYTGETFQVGQTRTFTFTGVVDIPIGGDIYLSIAEMDQSMSVDGVLDGSGDNFIIVDVNGNCSSSQDYVWSYGNTSTGNTDDPNYLPTGITNTFDQNEDVYINYEMVDVLVGGEVEIKIFNPSGSLIFTDNIVVDEPATGTIWDWYRGYWIYNFDTPGDYEIDFSFQPAGESNQFQETHDFTILGSTGLDDYTTSNAQVSNTSPEIGEEITLSCNQNYSGNNSNSNTVQLGYHLSIDQATNGNDIALAFDNSTLSSNNPSEFENVSVNIPPVTPGTYYIRFCADYPDDYDEDEEGNNCTSIQIQVQGSSNSTQFIVNTSNDTSDAIPGDGSCEDSNGNCSLRAALEESNANANANTILFESNITEVNFFNDDIDVIHPITIDGGTTGNVKVNGNNGSNEISIETNNSNIYGLWFYNFNQEGITFNNASNINIGAANKGCIFTQNNDGIFFSGTCSNFSIKGNYFGTDQSFSPNLGNGAGMDSGGNSTQQNFTVGGSFNSQESNYFCDNGIGIEFAADFTGDYIGNYFGTDPSLTVDLGNGNAIYTRGGTIGGSVNNKNVFYFGSGDQIRMYPPATTAVTYNDFYANDEDAIVNSSSTPQYIYQNTYECNFRVLVGTALDDAVVLEATTETISGTCLSGAQVEVHYSDNTDCPENQRCQGSEFIGFAQVSGTTWSITGNFDEGKSVGVMQHVNNQSSYWSDCLTVESSFSCDLDATPTSSATTCGLENGSIIFNISGGTAPITISLNSVDYTGQSTANSLSSGSYDLIISDSNNCMESYNVFVGSSFPLEANITITDTECGLNNGMIEVNPTNGTSPYTYIQGDQIMANLSPGAFGIVYEDAIGCLFSTSVSVASSSALNADISITDTECGLDNGIIEITPTNGIAPYLYSLGGAAPIGTGLYSDLPSGTYDVEVEDNIGCIFSMTVNVEEGEGVDLTVTTNPTTCGLDNGQIVANASSNAPGNITYVLSGYPPQSSGVFTNVPSGSYILEVIDSEGCTNSESVMVQTSDMLEANVSVQHTTCGETNGEITIVPTNGITPYTYSLGGNSQSSPVFSGLGSGSYQSLVIDGDGCEFIFTVTVNASTSLMANFESTHTSCGDNNGEVSAIITNGIPPYLIKINGGPFISGTNVMNLSAGAYSVDIQDSQGCEVSGSVIIDESIPLVVTAVIEDTKCNEENGTIEIIILQGNGNYEHTLVETGETQSSPTFSGLAPGDYSIQSIDGEFCSTTFFFTIEPSVDINFFGISNATSCGQINGSLEMIIDQGESPINFSINGGAASTDVFYDDLSSGNYIVVASDADGCILEQTFIIDESDEITVASQETHTTCGDDNGSILLTLVSGSAPSEYYINGIPVGSSGIITDLAPGTYEIDGVDSEGCETTIFVTIDPSIILDAVVNIEHTSCGEENGVAEISIISGNSPYEYSFDGSAFSPISNFGNLASGVYEVQIRDNEDCEFVTTVELLDSELPQMNIEIGNTTCGEDNGMLEFIPTAGVAPYLYDFGFGFQPNSIVSDLAEGQYDVLIQDNESCIFQYTVTIDGSEIADLFTAVTPENCGANDGVITLVSVSEMLPVNYTLESGTYFNSNFSGVFSNLEVGIYMGTATDADGCQVVEILEVTSVDGAEVSTTVVPSDCGQSNGQIELEIIGGNNPITIEVDGIEVEDEIIENLEAGEYSILVIDGSECETALLLEVTENIFEVDVEVNNAICIDGTGSVEFGVNMSSNYNYNLGGEENTTGLFVDLAEGTYNYSIIDENNCEVVGVVDVLFEDTFTIASETEAAACGMSNGTITIIQHGGVAPIIYVLDEDTENSSGVFNNQPAGLYSISVTDGNGCNNTIEVILEDEGGIISVIETSSDDCGAGMGTIMISAQGGDGDYSYTLDNILENNSGEFVGLIPGEYSVEVEDGQGCKEESIVTIQGSLPPSVIIETAQENCGENDGAIIVSVDSSEDFMYEIEGEEQNTDGVFNSISAGEYVVVITNSFNCEYIEEVFVSGSESISSSISVSEVSCGEDNGSIFIEIITGQAPFNFILNSDQTNDTGEFINLSAGSYSIEINDAEGCVQNLEVEVQDLGTLELGISSQSPVSCNEENGGVSVLASSGTPPYTYTLNGANANETGVYVGLSVGDYIVSAEDDEGCFEEVLVTILSEGLSSFDYETTLATCGEETGSIIISNLNGVQPYIYIIDGEPNDSAEFLNLGAGVYTLLIVDAIGCQIEEIVQINSSSDVELSVISTINPSFGESNGVVEVSATDGTPPYQYNIDGQTNDTGIFMDLTVGVYFVGVTDSEGCNVIIEVELEESVALGMTIDISNESCNESNGEISCNAFGGTGNYVFQLDESMPQESSLFSGLSNGTYIVTIYDDEGNEFSLEVDLVNVGGVEFESMITAPECGMNDGVIEINVLDGVGNYSYFLNGEQFEDAIVENLSSGIYLILVIDDMGCEQVEEIEILDSGNFEVFAITSSAKCENENGSINIINVDNENLMYSIDGENFQSESTFTLLGPGNYEITSLNVEDNCVVVTNVEIQSTPAVSFEYGISPPNCDEANGSISLQIIGGTGIVTVKLDDVIVENDEINNLEVGSYTISITDEEGCFYSETIILEAAELNVITPNTELYEICGDECNGEITLNLDPVVSEYLVYWPDGVSTLLTNSTLCPGDYNIPVEYNDGCIDYVEFTISQSIIFNPNVLYIDASCNDDNGAIFIQNAGGFDIVWSHGQTGNLLQGLGEGVYTFTIEGENGCLREESIEIIQTGAIGVNLDIDQITCHGMSDGEIDLGEISGGIAPYSILWSNGSTTNSISSLLPGTYSVTVTDSLGLCSNIITNLEISEPAELTGVIELTGDNIRVQSSGGIPPYSYLWNTGDNSQIINIENGLEYSVIITDANGCNTSVNYGVTSLEEIFSTLNIYPNPFRHLISISDIPEEVLSIEIFDVHGRLVDSPSNLSENISQYDFSNNPAGVYILRFNGKNFNVEKKIIHLK